MAQDIEGYPAPPYYYKLFEKGADALPPPEIESIQKYRNFQVFGKHVPAVEPLIPPLDPDMLIKPPVPLNRKRRFQWLVNSLVESIKVMQECILVDKEEAVSHLKHIRQISINLLYLTHESRVDEAKDMIVQLAKEQVLLLNLKFYKIDYYQIEDLKNFNF